MGITPLVIPFLVHEQICADSSICQRADLEIESKQMNWSVKTNEHDKNAVPDFHFRKWQKPSKCVICHKFLWKNDSEVHITICSISACSVCTEVNIVHQKYYLMSSYLFRTDSDPLEFLLREYHSQLSFA